MYDELIKNLRICSKCDFGQNCNECTQRSEDRFCCDVLLHKAADAIENLEQALDVAQSNLSEFLYWNPVTERLPEENNFYLCFYKAKHSGGVATDKGLSILQYFNGKWNLIDIYSVTHWMPLPEPPKEIKE